MKQSVPGQPDALTWQPTKANQTPNSHLRVDAELDVVIHEVQFSEVVAGCDTAKVLYLVTTRDISRRFSTNRENRNRLRLAFDRLRLKGHDREAISDSLSRGLRDEKWSAERLGQSLDTRRQVHRITDRCVFETVFRSHAADDGCAGVDADSDAECLNVGSVELGVHFRETVDHVEPC